MYGTFDVTGTAAEIGAQLDEHFDGIEGFDGGIAATITDYAVRTAQGAGRIQISGSVSIGHVVLDALDGGAAAVAEPVGDSVAPTPASDTEAPAPAADDASEGVTDSAPITT